MAEQLGWRGPGWYVAKYNHRSENAPCDGVEWLDRPDAPPSGYGQSWQTTQYCGGRGSYNKPYHYLPTPLAVVGQWVVVDGQPARVFRLEIRNDYVAEEGRYRTEWVYATPTRSGIRSDEIQPHPRPDHGGPIIDPNTAAQIAVLTLQTAKLDTILELHRDALRPPPPPEVEAPVVIEPPEFLVASIDGAKDGAAAVVFVVLADRALAAAWFPSGLQGKNIRYLLPYLLCLALYVGCRLLPGVPGEATLRSLSLRAVRGCATILVAGLSPHVAAISAVVLQHASQVLNDPDQ